MAPVDTPLLRVENVSKRFSGITVLRDGHQVGTLPVENLDLGVVIESPRTLRDPSLRSG